MVYQVAKVIKHATAADMRVELELIDVHFHKESKARDFLIECELLHERDTYVIISY